MSNLNLVLKNIQDLDNKLSIEKQKIQSVLDIVGLSAKFDCGFYVKEYNEDPRSEMFFSGGISLNSFIIEQVGEVDYPITRDQGNQLAKLFDFSPKQREAILEKCASPEQYEKYCDYEKRNNDF